jgi:hypothetical protein
MKIIIFLLNNLDILEVSKLKKLNSLITKNSFLNYDLYWEMGVSKERF